MEYQVHIYKASNPEEVHVEHYAARDTTYLTYLGSDSKTQPIVTSELGFTLEVLNGEDGKYLQYFTPDEKEWVVEKRIAASQEVIWKGFLLPESYSEPYTYPTFYPAFSAVDGLGLLKGKYLTPDFYEDEKTVIDVILACIQLTQVDFDLYSTPAIKNALKDNWKDIFMDSRHYLDADKKESAYQILEGLVASLQCQLFQSSGKWFLEGINKKHLLKNTYYRYSFADRSFLGTEDLTKNLKRITSFEGEALITMVPALGEITVSHAAAELKLNKDLVKETRTPWILPAGIAGKFNARYWDFTFYDGFISPPNYFLELTGSHKEILDLEKFIAIKEKPFVLKGTKIKIELAVEFVPEFQNSPVANWYFNAGLFINCLVFRISLAGTTLFFNDALVDSAPEYLALDSSGKGSVIMDFIAQEDGLLNIELFEPRGDFSGTQTAPAVFRVTKLTAEDIDQKKDFIYTEIIDEGSSQKEEIDLEFSEDISGSSKCFYLEKIREFDNATAVAYQVPILYGRQLDGKNYSIINLAGAVLIETYPTQVYWQQSAYPVKNPVIHYNLNGGNEIAVETSDYFFNNAFWVPVAKYKPATISRLKALEWTDAVFGIEKKPYAQVVAEIRRKLFFKPHIMINGTVPFPVKYNDLLSFKYRGEEKYFMPTNIEWQGEAGSSVVTLIEGVYSGQSSGNIPPYVEAGPDIILQDGQTTAQISEAYVQDNDGFIANQVWQITAGDPGATFSSINALNPLISNLTGNSYTARLTATDNLGAAAFDTMQIIRISGYTLILTPSYTKDYFDSVNKFDVKERKWLVSIAPDAPGNNFLNAGITAKMDHNFNGQGSTSVLTDSSISFYVNGQRVFYTGRNYKAYRQKLLEYVATISFSEEDVVELELINKVAVPAFGFPGYGSSTLSFSFDTVGFVIGSGSITNLPVVETLAQSVNPRNT